MCFSLLLLSNVCGTGSQLTHTVSLCLQVLWWSILRAYFHFAYQSLQIHIPFGLNCVPKLQLNSTTGKNGRSQWKVGSSPMLIARYLYISCEWIVNWEYDLTRNVMQTANWSDVYRCNRIFFIIIFSCYNKIKEERRSNFSIMFILYTHIMTSSEWINLN